jgi:hypothetical protein
MTRTGGPVRLAIGFELAENHTRPAFHRSEMTVDARP